jgi:hypothetical protein
MRDESRPSAPAGSPPAMTPEQLEIVDWLQRNVPALADVFAGAITFMATTPPAYVKFVAHGVREIRNALPEILSGVKEGRFEYINKLDALYQQRDRAGLLAPNLFVSDEKKPPAVPVPFKQFRQCAELLKEHRLARERTGNAAQRLAWLASLRSLAAADATREGLRVVHPNISWMIRMSTPSASRRQAPSCLRSCHRRSIFLSTGS